MTFASGGSFSKFSHEFQTLSEAGEDTIYLSRKKNLAINKEVLTDDVLEDLSVTHDELEEVKAIEVGNIFSLGTKFSQPVELAITDESGEPVTLIMGCYGIGVSRVMGTIAELFADDKGLVWPEEIAPAQVLIVRVGDNPEVVAASDSLYETLQNSHVEVLYDDRDLRPGEKFADADLLGIPHRVVVSPKTLEQGKIEYKQRTEAESTMLSEDELLKKLAR